MSVTISKMPKQYNLLHDAALTKNLNLIVKYICLGIDINIVDKNNKKFMDYLEQWEITYITNMIDAWKNKKIYINTYRDYFEGYLSYGYTSKGNPMLPIIWEHNLGRNTLQQILDFGVDISHPCIINSVPPIMYAKLLAQYGWIPKDTNLLQSITNETNEFYPPDIWSDKDKNKNYSNTIIKEYKMNILGTTIQCISDTHCEHNKLNIPNSDILICSGDLCMPWTNSLYDFITWFGNQPHKYKLLVAGNHDKLLQENKNIYFPMFSKYNITYLEDNYVEIEGLKIWGSPWTYKRPKNKNNAFTLSRTELMTKWNLIPSDIDILITHCPPYSVGDCNTEYFKSQPNQGDFGLYKTINRLHKLKLHAFGHQHYGRGIYKGSNNVIFVNSALNEYPEPISIIL